jgi:hypothetical protein
MPLETPEEMPEAMPENSADGESEADDLRVSLRHVLPEGVSASVRLESGRSVYVNVRDISRTGACVVRRGGLEVKENENVIFDVSDFEIQQKVSLTARVQWVSASGYNTIVGLVFNEGPVLPGTLLDAYLDQSLMAHTPEEA